MSDDLAEVLARQQKRYQVLYFIYKSVVPRADYFRQYIELSKATEATRLSADDVQEAFDYFVNEGLLESLGDEGVAVSLTHAGKVEMERSITHPQRETEHFAVQVLMHFHAPVASVQSGNRSIAEIK